MISFDYHFLFRRAELPTKHSNTKYILEAFAKNKHIRSVKAARANQPSCLEDWFDEAIASYKEDPFDGIIASKNTMTTIKSQLVNSHLELIASIENIEKADWWTNRSHSVRLKRQTQDYLQHLRLLLNHANSLIFIDPYFNPNKPDYQEFTKILDAINQPDDPPSIEIHLCHLEPGVTKTDFERLFKRHLESFIQSKKLEVEIFIRDQIHDRFILTNFIGIQSGNSFSISRNPDETTTWTRISRTRRDELQKEFARNSRDHKLQHYFTVS
jgi:hypothetical protein